MLIFAFQAENLTAKWSAVILLAIPILIQVYFNSSLTYLLMRWLKVPHNVASTGALIGVSNFFELAVAITIFGSSSGAAPGLRRGGAGGSARDAFGMPSVQPLTPVVSNSDILMRPSSSHICLHS